jgi:hypothetical protein
VGAAAAWWLFACGALVFVVVGVWAGSVQAASYPIPGFFDCPGPVVTSHFPAITVPVATRIKPYSLTYGVLDLHWNGIGAGAGATCSVQSDVGALPVLVTFPLVGTRHVADSVAVGRLDFLAAPPTSVKICDWKAITSSCSLNGIGPLMVRWSTLGFDEQVSGHSVYNSGPLTYYARVGSGDVSAEIPALELFIHRTLISHLPLVTKVAVVQEPPADVQVRDSAGRITGRTLSGGLETGIPDSLYFTDGAGYAVVVLLAAGSQTFTATAIGDPGGNYSLSISSLLPTVDGAAQVTDQTKAGVLDSSGSASVEFVAVVKQLIWFSPYGTVYAFAPRHRRGVRAQSRRVRVSYRPPQARDGAGRRVPAVCSPKPGSLFRIGTTLVRCTAREPLAPVAYATFRVVVKRRPR